MHVSETFSYGHVKLHKYVVSWRECNTIVGYSYMENKSVKLHCNCESDISMFYVCHYGYAKFSVNFVHTSLNYQLERTRTMPKLKQIKPLVCQKYVKI